MLGVNRLLRACLLTISLHSAGCLAVDVCELGGVSLLHVPVFALLLVSSWQQKHCQSVQAIVQLSSNNHTYEGVPSNPSVLPRNQTLYVPLTLASPQDACQPIRNTVAGTNFAI